MDMFLIFMVLFASVSAQDADDAWQLDDCLGGFGGQIPSPNQENLGDVVNQCAAVTNDVGAVDECASFEDTIGWLQARYANEICVLQGLGMLGDALDGAATDAAVSEDDVPDEVVPDTSAFDFVGDEAAPVIDACVDGMSIVSYVDCDYSEDQKANLAFIGQSLATWICTREAIMQQCTDNVAVMANCGAAIDETCEVCDTCGTDIYSGPPRQVTFSEDNEVGDLDCDDFASAMQWFGSAYDAELCVIGEIGANTEAPSDDDVTAYSAFIAGLNIPQEAAEAAGAFEPYWNGCVDGLRELGEDTANDECLDNFTEEEQLAVEGSAMVIGRYECFRAYLQTVCLGAYAVDAATGSA
jgi:hypothetical protein